MTLNHNKKKVIVIINGIYYIIDINNGNNHCSIMLEKYTKNNFPS